MQIGKFSANGTSVYQSENLSFAPRWQWAYGNLPAHNTDEMKWHWGPTCTRKVKFQVVSM